MVQPIPPIECRLFLSTKNPGAITLTSVDLHSSVVMTHVSQVFNYAADYLGLLKAGLGEFYDSCYLFYFLYNEYLILP
jgi:hypothetical protein